MHCYAYTKHQLPVIIVDLQDVNLIVASEKGLKLHLNFYSAIWYLFQNQNIKDVGACKFSVAFD